MKKTIDLTCPTCSQVFTKLLKYYINQTKTGQTNFYCSRKCMNISSETKTLACAKCNKPIIINSSRKNRSKSGLVYCSRSCSTANNNTIYKSKENNPNWLGGKQGYRNLVDTSKCSCCSENRYWHIIVHHIDGNRENSNLDNLEVICQKCHIDRHLKEINGKILLDFNYLTSPELKEKLFGK